MNDDVAAAASSVLPRNIGPCMLAFLFFMIIDLVLFWNMAGFLYAQCLLPIFAAAGEPVSSNDALIDYLGSSAVLAMPSILNFLICPLMMLSGRVVTAIAMFRKLCWAIIILHIAMCGIVVREVIVTGHLATGFISPLALVGVPATPLLYFIAQPLLTMRFLRLKAPPESWGTLMGVDAPLRRSITACGGQTSSVATTMFLTPLACWRARWYVRACLSAGLIAGGGLLFVMNPLAVFPALAANAVIGRQLLNAAGRPSVPAEVLSDSERKRRLDTMFPPSRLTLPPFGLPTGLIGQLFLLPCLLDGVWYASILGQCRTIRALGSVNIDALAWLPFIAVPFGVVVTGVGLGLRFSIVSYRAVSVVIVFTHLLLIAYFTGLITAPFGPPPPGSAALLWPVALLLVAFLPLSAAMAASFPTIGRLPSLIG